MRSHIYDASADLLTFYELEAFRPVIPTTQSCGASKGLILGATIMRWVDERVSGTYSWGPFPLWPATRIFEVVASVPEDDFMGVDQRRARGNYTK